VVVEWLVLLCTGGGKVELVLQGGGKFKAGEGDRRDNDGEERESEANGIEECKVGVEARLLNGDALTEVVLLLCSVFFKMEEGVLVLLVGET